TGGDCHDAWLQMKPDLIICEATLPDRLVDDADAYGHLTPSKIEHELRDFQAVNGYLPRVIVVHIDPKHEAEIHDDISLLAERLHTPIEIGYEGMLIDL
ncbi:MAG TPA: lactamase, partial [Chloroflexia bacterium]|nr:lactamase [Chloroflexia bacterium]